MIIIIELVNDVIIPISYRTASGDMDPVTGLWFITGVGIVLLLGLFGVCAFYAYLTVRSHMPQDEH